MTTEGNTHGTGESDAKKHALDSTNVKAIVRLSLTFALIFAWWGSFHEIACGCLSLRSMHPLEYTYVSCYAHSLGCTIGAIAAIASLHKGWRLPPWRPGIIAGLGTGASVVFSACVALGVYPVAAIVQFAISAAVAPIIAAFLTRLSKLPFSQACPCLIVCLAVYIAANNVLMPALMITGDSMTLSGAFQALLPIASVIALRCRNNHGDADAIENAFRADVDAAKQPRRIPNAATVKGSREAEFPWPLAFSIAVYFFVFGVMHVESSTLINVFHNRNVLYMAGYLLTTIIFIVLFQRFFTSKKGTGLWTLVRNIVFPLTVSAFLFLPLLNSFDPALPVALSACSDLLYMLLMALGIKVVSQESRTSAFFLALVLLAMAPFAYFMGSIFAQALLALLPFNFMLTPYASAGAFILLVAATLWIGDDFEARKIWGFRVKLAPHDATLEKLLARCAYLAKNHQLTQREREILELVSQNRRPAAISEELSISVNTVRSHIKSIYVKLDVHSSDELLKLINDLPASELQ